MHARVTVRIPPELELAMLQRKKQRGESYNAQLIGALARHLGVVLKAPIQRGRVTTEVAQARAELRTRPPRKLAKSDYAF